MTTTTIREAHMIERLMTKMRKVIAKGMLFVISIIGVAWLVVFALLVSTAKWLED